MIKAASLSVLVGLGITVCCAAYWWCHRSCSRVFHEKICLDRGKFPLEWDLRCFYKTGDSKVIEADMKSVEKHVASFCQKFLGKLTIENLGEAVEEYENILTLSTKIGTYSFLRYQTNLTDHKIASFFQKYREWWSAESARMAFFQVDASKLDYSTIKAKMKSDEKLSRYRSFIDELLRFSDHFLSTPEEIIMEKMEVPAGSSWVKFYENFLSRLECFIDGKKKDSGFVRDETANGKTSEDREKASRSLSEAISKNLPVFTAIYNNIILANMTYRELRKFRSPEESRYLEDNVSQDVVEAMLSASNKKLNNIIHRYYKIKAKLLKKDKMQYWDRGACVRLTEDNDNEVSYDEAVELVLSIFSNFSQRFYSISKNLINGGIDVAPKATKISGGFSHPATVHTHPFILLNFRGTMRDVLVLAHELGHGVHQTLSAERQTQLNVSAPLILAEMASTFAEKLLYDYLIENEKNERKKVEFMCRSLDDIMNTVFRQIAFFVFERRIHRLRQVGEISTEDLNKIWRETQVEILGDGVEIDQCVDNFWCCIHHFFVSPFYVYSYAFGRLVVEALYTKYKENPDDFVKKYENLLGCGRAVDIKMVAFTFDLDINSEDFWEKSLESIEEQVDKLEDACKQENLL